jgi:TRAP-type mannitol/chloroaromatic compound transport system permease small subunit
MRPLLRIAAAIDTVNAAIGRAAYWLVLVAVLVSAGNALARYSLNASSNAWLEIQWYLYSAVFLLCAPYTLQRNEHVRIDIFFARLPPRARAWIDVCGIVLFLMPMAIIIAWFAWPMFVESYVRGEYSSDAGGLLRWPAKILIPVGFALLALQGIAELIKRIAFLAGVSADLTAPPRATALDLVLEERR